MITNMTATSASPPITAHIDRASFSLWSKEDIKKISVKKITEPKSFEKGGVMHPEGLYSPALGACKMFDICVTCNSNNYSCPGHYGHIELSVPVFHPMLVQTMYQILSKCCLECHHFRMSQTSLKLFLAQMEALNLGFDYLIEELEDIAADMCRDGKSDADPYIHVTLNTRLAARIKEEREKNPDFDCQKRPQQRNIVESLSKLFRTFIMGKLIKPLKQCPQCHEKKISMSLHQQSVLVVGVNSNKPIEDLIEDGKPKAKRSYKKKKKVQKHEKSNNLHYLCTDEKRFLTPLGARDHFRKLWKNERRTMERIFHFLNFEVKEDGDRIDAELSDDDNPKEAIKKANKFQPVDLFFVDTILVPPSKFRPPMSQRGYSFEGPRTAAMGNVLKHSIVVQDLIDQMINEVDEIEAEKLQMKVQTAWKNLQIAVNSLWDNEMDKYGKNKYPGLKQLIDKKEGLFRKNMMGKRVNFAARSVISPDPNILVDQIGVPLVFAKKLTYPQPVTPWNISQLKEAVLNGPHTYPGAVSVVYEDGSTVSLTKESTRQNLASRLSYHPRLKGNRAKRDTHMGTIVNRHLLTGDVLLFNRQPTLHKPSIMAFRARVLPNEKGFRLHYANCKSFNADFDGDEMNAHLPQSEVARAEAYHIASVNHQYLVPKDGSPLGGLIQDHVVAVCILTGRDQFFDEERYNQLVYCALSFLDKPIKLEPPTIRRPVHLWTGKQVITTLIKNCIPEGKLAPSLDIKSKIGPKVVNIMPEYEKLSDCHVIIRNGELLVGYMDKSNVGATQYGLVHICYELYGGETSSALMSAFARLATWYLQLYEGFTLGIADILVDDDANNDRWQSIQKSLVMGNDSAKEALGITGQVPVEILTDRLREAHSDRDQLPMKKLDAAMKTRTDKIASEISARCLPNGLIKKFPDNNLQMMIQSGAKGGTVNALQISCLLGQIELEGRRVPLSMSGRSLPSFVPYDTSPKAGGFVSGRFLTGIQPQEFFFHCMAGREGLIDTAVKTSRSGYLQRCLIKHLEGLTVHYDQTVRDSCGSVVQFLYGEDGLDICKSQMLKDKAFPALIDNQQIISPNVDELVKLNKAKEDYEEDVIARTEEIQLWLERNGEDRIRNVRGSGFLDFLHTQMHQPVSFDLDLSQVPADSMEEDEPIKAGTEQEPPSIQLTGEKLREVVSAWYALSFKEKRKWMKRWECCPDPLTSIMNPASHYGVVPERLDKRIEDFVRKNPQLIVDSASLIGETSGIVCDENPELSKSILAHWHGSNHTKSAIEADWLSNKPKMTKHEFYNLCYNLYMKMLAQPGEAVGLLAAQSIGEPSTQMTLNTFHFAGRGEMNVTLGIPRLREILMTASVKIRTPSMDLPLLNVIKDEFGNELDEAGCEEQAKRVKLALNAVRLSDVLEYIDITEQVIGQSLEQKPIRGGGDRSSRKRTRAGQDRDGLSQERSVRYELKFNLLPSKYYKHEFKSSSSRVMKFIEEVFVGQLVESMVKRQKRLILADKIFDLSTKTSMKKVHKSDEADDTVGQPPADGEEDPEEQDLDNYNAKAKQRERANEDESSSEDDDDVDGDNTTQKIKNRRNQDLDYEEPEDDDLDIGDTEARGTGADEEAEPEILAEEQVEEATRSSKQAEKAASRSRKVKLEPIEEIEEGEPDELTRNVMEEAEENEDEQEENVGRKYELAGFDESANNTRSGFETPLNATLDEDEEAEEADNHEDNKGGVAAKRAKMLEDESVAAKAAEKLAKKSKFDQETIEQRINRVKCKPNVVDYTFDIKRERWCKLTLMIPLSATRLDMGALLELEAKRTYIHRVGNISRALIVKDVDAKSRGAKCDKMIKTEGVSLLSLVRFNHILNLNAIYSNDIHAIANTYGIEAASQAIRREMANVFAVYGIEVDSRHLSLIADYMTYNGAIRGMNRMSMEASASPFQQMSYESTIRYLKWAAILGLYDDIKSPSASLVFGRPTRGGTGLFGLLADPQPQPLAHRIAHKPSARKPAVQSAERATTD